MKRDLVDSDGDGVMSAAQLTEAEFRFFAERFAQFVEGLTPNENLFLLTVLARATMIQSEDVHGLGSSPESAICAELAYSVWQSTLSPERFIAPNPQPIPARAGAAAAQPDASRWP